MTRELTAVDGWPDGQVTRELTAVDGWPDGQVTRELTAVDGRLLPVIGETVKWGAHLVSMEGAQLLQES